MNNTEILSKSHVRWLVNEVYDTDVSLHVNPSKRLVEIRDERIIDRKVIDVVKAVFNHLKTLVIRVYRKITTNKDDFAVPSLTEKGYEYASEDFPWKNAEESTGLYLFLHGLRGDPTHWNGYLEEVAIRNPRAHVFAPRIPLEGNCALHIAADPLSAVVKDYLNEFPGQSVTVVTTSNGSRIGAYLESHLDPDLLGTSTFTLVSLAGVHYGTKFVDLLKRTGLLPLANLDSELQEEFLYGSAVAQENLLVWQQKQEIWKERHQKVYHLFCATTEDENVRDVSCALPYHDSCKTSYKVVSGQSHLSIVDGVRQDVFSWLDLRGIE